MKFRLSNVLVHRTLMLLALTWLSAAQAETTDLASIPLANAPSATVLPNLMYILDDSGSMAWDYMPDNVYELSDNTSINNCKTCGGSSSCTTANKQCTAGEPPYYSAQFNQIYYNPAITYHPAVNSDGSSRGSYGSPWTAVKTNPYLSSSTINLTTKYPEIVYCNTSSPSLSDLTNASKCKRNGIHNGAFLYWGTSGTNVGYPQSTNSSGTTYRYAATLEGAPYYFTITPIEHCSDANLTNCIASTIPSGMHVYPATVRYCATKTDAAAAAPVSGGAPKCRKKFDRTNYPYPRYGSFTRTDIVSTTTSYPKAVTRTDCAGATCTYAEEMTNFANWYAYYRTRLQMMKTVTGRAFLPVDDRYRVGFVTINPNNPVTSSKYLKIDTFNATHRSNWYSKLYAQDTNGSTPLREALSRVGRHYANVTTGINSGMSEDPIQYSCQQNFALLTTDGYWNGNAGVKIDGTAVGNQDNADSGYSTRAVGAYDGGLAGSSGSLADTAMYYYKTDLRSSGSVATDNVPTTTKDSATHQHMTTFTLGLGLSGLMDYRSDYDTAASGDFKMIKNADPGCSWTAGTCNWPVPAQNAPSALDDLWHSAVNGRGLYFSASDPNSLGDGIAGALSALKVQTGAAAAAATSSPILTITDRAFFSSTFRTVYWDGEIKAQLLDPTTGKVQPSITWSAQGQLDARVSASSDTRTIHTFDSGVGTKLKSFQWATLTAAEQAYFSNKCTALSQCPTLSAVNQANANSGLNLIGYLRGQTQFEIQSGNATQIYRDREHVLGDTVHSTPAYIKAPRWNFADSVTPSYASFKSGNSSRQAMLYIGANDGMLHALNADTGAEMWAYVPRIVFPRLHMLATENWDIKHEFYVDGSPQIMDAFIGGAWKTLLVSGLGKGGRGYFALDITDPANPKGLWEICADSALCSISDSDLGYTFGNPVITKRASDGKWIVLVTSGYNNVSPGTGRGYLFVLDAATGAILEKIDTGVGNTTTPNGLAKFAAYANNFNADNTTVRAYGGDLLGNVWRFDLTTSPATVAKIAELKDASGKPQSVTTRPELAEIDGRPVVYVGTGRYLGPNDLPDPATLTPPLPYAYQQSLYAFKDTGVNNGNLRTSVNMVQQIMSQPSATTRKTTDNPVDWTSKLGWFVDFNPGNASPGERVSVEPQLVLGALLVATNVPTTDACSFAGSSWFYQFHYSSGGALPAAEGGVTGEYLGNALTADFLTVQPTTLKPVVNVTQVDGTIVDKTVNLSGTGPVGRRISWRELIQD